MDPVNLPTPSIPDFAPFLDKSPGCTLAATNCFENQCWGDNGDGQLGYGDNKTRGALVTDMGEALAVVNLGTNFTVSAVALGEKHTCALAEDGGVKCWGEKRALH